MRVPNAGRAETKRYGTEQPARRTWNQLEADITVFPWPYIALNDRCEITAQNPPSVRVFGRTIRRELLGPVDRDVITFLMSAFAQERILNWDEVTTALIPRGLRAMAGNSSRRSSARLTAAATELRRRDAEAIARLVEYWREALAANPESRISFPVAWRADDGEVLAFQAVVSWQNYGVAWAMDWHPADAATWAWLAIR